MAEYNDSWHDYVAATDSTHETISAFKLVAAAAIVSIVTMSNSAVFSDTAAATDNLTDRSLHVFYDTAAATDSVTSSTTGTGLYDSTAIARGGIAETVIENRLSSTAAATNDTFITTIAITSDTAAATDEVTSNSTLTDLYSSSASADGDISRVVRFAPVSSTAAATDEVTSHSILTDLYSSTAAGSSSVESSETVTSLLTSTAAATDSITQQLVALALYLDNDALADGFIVADGGVIWSASTDTFGMTQWDAALSDLTYFGDRMLALSDGDIVSVDGTGDVIGSISTGITDLGSDKLQRVSYLYAGFICNDQITVKVTNTGDGISATFAYDMEARTATALTSGRIKLGRGARSRYWDFELTNLTGDRFVLRDVELETDNTSRRI